MLLRAHSTAIGPPLPQAEVQFAVFAERRAKEANLPIINGVVEESIDIAAIARSRNMSNVRHIVGNTTVSETMSAIQQANIVHLACHGIQDSLNATQSGFCLGDGRLTISKLMDVKLDNAFLAFLSACQTAAGDQEQPDQAMHLAAAMLFCGFKSVIATMW
jgi:CHAT domain-containing protein